MTLHLYFARKFTLTLLGILGLFGTVMVLLGMVDQLRDFEIGTIGIPEALHLSALRAPEELYTILPLVVVLATVTLFLRLARSSELVITRASGRSAFRSLIAPVTMAAIYGAIAIAIFNPIVATTIKTYDIAASRYQDGARSVLSVSSEGLWLRQGGEDGQMVIRATRANAEATEFYDLTFLALGADGNPVWRIDAARAELTASDWQLHRVKRWTFGPDIANPEAAATEVDTLLLPSDLTRDRIRNSFARPDAISIWDLPQFIAGLERAGFAARPHRVWFQMELASPLFLVAMVLVGAGLTMRHTRFGRTGLMVMIALALGLALFFLRNFAQVLGDNGQIPVALAAWSPPLAGVLLSLGLLLHLEDG